MQITIGQQFRQFRILERIGAGGMGVVYRARDERLDRDVALKFLTNAGAYDTAYADRLRREARSLAALNHPNIVTIHEIGDDEGVPFLVLEWIDGVPLDHPDVARPMPTATFLAIAHDIAAGLARAHQGGVIHRDLKPANVLLTRDGRAKLVDFGVAKVAESDGRLTASGFTVGTVSYMSPEQASADEVGPPSDIYSFGAMAYELLTGSQPLPARGVGELLFEIFGRNRNPIQESRPDLPPALVALVDRCLARDPAERFADGEALRVAIDAVMAGAPTEAVAPVVARVPPRRGMEQSIRFCRTADGIRIAYATVGAGPPLVRVLGHFTHLEMEWDWPELRMLWEELAQRNTVVRYDGRGIGLSDPWREEFTEETRQLDLEAVLKAIGTEPVTLLGISEGGWTAASHAIAHPGRVKALILYGSYCRGAQARPGYDAEEDTALVTLIRKGWGRDTPAFRQVFTSQFFQEDADPDLLAHFNEIQRASADGDTAARYHASIHMRGDGESMYSAITVPTLVVHGKHDQVTDAAEGRLLASVIPGAELVMLPAYGHYFPIDADGVARVVAAIRRFLHDASTSGAGPAEGGG